MRKFSVSITDGNDIRHTWYVSANNKYDALCAILDTFHKASYGMPYGIMKDGIKGVCVKPIDMSTTVVH